jgi:hypothetical protein
MPYFISLLSSSLSFNLSGRSAYAPLCLFGPTPYRRVAHTRSLSFSHSACLRLCSSLSSIHLFFILVHSCILLTHFLSPFSILMFSALSFNAEINVISHRCPKQKILSQQRYLFSSSFDTSSSNQNQLGPPKGSNFHFSFRFPTSFLSIFKLSRKWF